MTEKTARELLKRNGFHLDGGNYGSGLYIRENFPFAFGYDKKTNKVTAVNSDGDIQMLLLFA